MDVLRPAPAAFYRTGWPGRNHDRRTVLPARRWAMRKPGLCGRRAARSFRIARPVAPARSRPNRKETVASRLSCPDVRSIIRPVQKWWITIHQPSKNRPFSSDLRCFSRFWGGGFCAI